MINMASWPVEWLKKIILQRKWRKLCLLSLKFYPAVRQYSKSCNYFQKDPEQSFPIIFKAFKLDCGSAREPDGIMQLCSQLRFHLVYKHSKQKNMVYCQCAKSAAWRRAHTGYTPQLSSSRFFFPSSSVLFCIRDLKIASSLSQNKHFMDSGFDAVFAWRGQLSPARRKTRPYYFILNIFSYVHAYFCNFGQFQLFFQMF